MSAKKEYLHHFLLRKREELGLTQSDVAKRLKYSSAQYISNWERGLCPPPMSRLAELAQVYKINKNEFMKVVLQQTKWELETQFADRANRRKA